MTRFVVVEASPFLEGLRARVRPCTVTGGSSRRASAVIDEHFVVDVDVCRDGRLLDCADVLQGSRAHSVVDALRRLADLTAAHPACGIAAVPLAGTGGGSGGWAVAGGSDRAVILVPYGPNPEYPKHSRRVKCRPYPAAGQRALLPSYLHAWLAAGRSLREWPHARTAPSG
ncbi:hypothetical protein OG705_27585 [Streptomyces sp. NBC_00838]|uniref:hypothetical protein n=1 Tax=Streptomyces sp. NBC_00838 TaxID=2903680 RepID=UPI00386D7D95|nr:hypothetical protein OG705_27585 [Streptomyces sp. NBC_00838]